MTLREYLTLIEAMGKDLADRRVESFYYLSRAALVKDERNLDKFDRVFGHVFKGLDLVEEALAAEIPIEWLKKLTEKYLTEDEKKLTAFHEAGHALCMLYAEGHEPLHKVTIIPRGRALGVTMFLPERDKYSQSKTEIKAMLASLFGGRVAEELIFGQDKVTTGASDDIKRATGLARRMVTEFGFSEKLGPLRYSENEEEVFLGHSVTQRKNVSDATAKVIDDEIRRIVEEGEHTARDILTTHLDELHALAHGLLEYETLSSDEIRRVIKGERIIRDTSTGTAPSTDDPRPGPGRRSSVPPSGRQSGIGPEPEPQPGG